MAPIQFRHVKRGSGDRRRFRRMGSDAAGATLAGLYQELTSATGEALDLITGVLEHGGTLAAEITAAVNAAIDDLARRAAAGALADVAGELDQVSESFDRAIDAVTTELERAERRLDGR